MYSQLSSTMTCQVQVGNELKTMGVAEAGGLLQKADERTRKDAWLGINAAWRTHEESCAAAINAIAGWRLEMNRKRSKVRPVHFLDAPVHMNRLEPPHPGCIVGRDRRRAPAGAPRNEGDGARERSRADRAVGHARPGAAVGGDERPMPFETAIELIADAYGRSIRRWPTSCG